MNLILRSVFIALVIVITSACDDKPANPAKETAKPVKLLTISSDDLYQIRSFPGKTEASQNVELSFQVSGKLIEFPVNKGTELKKDALIARLDPSDYQLKVNEARALRDAAQEDYKRAQELIETKYISQSDFEKKKAEAEISQANLELAEQNLAYTSLYAPFTGLVADTYPDNHQYVNAKQAIILLQDVSHIDVVVEMPESILLKLGKYDVKERKVTFEGYPSQEYDVVYKKHKSTADEFTQTYTVYFTLEQPKEINVYSGMTATVKIKFRETDAPEGTRRVPTTAVFSDDSGKKFVWKVDKETSRLKAHQVEIGQLFDTELEVLSGLDVGDTIVVTGVNFLHADQLVTEWLEGK